MSRMAALVFLVAAASPPPPAATITAEQAMANYRTIVKGSVAGATARCPDIPTGDIVVCGNANRPAPRLPLPDERPATRALPDNKADGAAAFEARLGCRMGCDPRESGTKMSRLIKILTGEDPDD